MVVKGGDAAGEGRETKEEAVEATTALICL